MIRKRLAQLEGYTAEGDVFGVDWAAAEGRYPTLVNEASWPVPAGLLFREQGCFGEWSTGGTAPERVVITDELGDFAPGTAYLRPPSLIAGIHPSPHADPGVIEQILVAALAEAGLARSSVFAVATADHTRNDRSIRRLGYLVRTFRAHELDGVNVPNPSSSLRNIVGTHSVCEASALLAAGPSAHLVVERTRTKAGTIALARRKPIRDVVVDLTAP